MGGVETASLVPELQRGGTAMVAASGRCVKGSGFVVSAS
jgi:hypothetical protein